MANGNGVSKQAASIYAAIALILGGGGGAFAGSAQVDRKIENLDSRVDEIAAEQRAIRADIKNLDERMRDQRAAEVETNKEILRLLRGIEEDTR